MFGLFSKKYYQPSVTAEDKEWIEKNIIWFIEAFGLTKLSEKPFILPSIETFPYDDLKNPEQFHGLFEQLCFYWDVGPNDINVKFFDDIKSKQWTTLVPQGSFNQPGGLYYQSYTTDQKRFNIQLAKSNLDHPQLLVAVLAHKLAHVKLLGGNYIKQGDPDMEAFTDLASIFFGFGIFVANSCQTTDIYWITRQGYLPNELISYTNALLCYITNNTIQDFIPFLNSNTKTLFKQDYEFLVNTGDTLLTKQQVEELVARYDISKQISEGFEKRHFDQAIEGCKKLLESDPKNNAAYNSLGYAMLSQKRYKEAIEAFTKAIDIEPYWDYPYNNRGYCKLQLQDFENAFADLHSPFEMNPDNSFSWRNFGAYYLVLNEVDKALLHFEQAEKIDPKTELINFYLGHTHKKLNNIERANQYFKKSKDLNEHNDSTIDNINPNESVDD